MPKIIVGDVAPVFSLPGLPNGTPVDLSDFHGRRVILYFYPKAMTPGCTTQACDFRDLQAQWTATGTPTDRGTVVLGVSPDPIAALEKFAARDALPFPLLSDVDHAVCEQYGVWVEKNNYGKKSMGVQRATFLIDQQGIVVAVWPRVKAAGHAAAVAAKLAELEA